MNTETRLLAIANFYVRGECFLEFHSFHALAFALLGFPNRSLGHAGVHDATGIQHV